MPCYCTIVHEEWAERVGIFTWCGRPPHLPTSYNPNLLRLLPLVP
jgi:hypothetical protein